MKNTFFYIAGLLLIRSSSYAQADSSLYWKTVAKEWQKIANENALAARAAENDARRQTYLAVAKETASKSLEINDQELRALLASQASNFNKKWGGYDFDNAIYNGLTAALKKYDSLPVKMKSHSQMPSGVLKSAKRDSIRKGNVTVRGNERGEILIMVNGLVKRKLLGHHARIDQIEFSPSGRFVISVSKDMVLCIWNWSDVTKPPLMIKETYSIENVMFSADETQVIIRVSDKDTPIHIWPLRLEILTKKLCSCIERNMTKEEWEQYVGSIGKFPYEATCNTFPRNDK